MKAEKVGDSIVMYGANAGRHIVKGTLHANNSQELVELSSTSAIKEIDLHPETASLLVLNEEGVQLLEENYILPFQLQNRTIHDFSLHCHSEEDAASFHLFLITHDQHTFTL